MSRLSKIKLLFREIIAWPRGMCACVCVCGNTNLWKTVGTFHRPKAIAGHSNVSMIFVRCIILVTYNESQFITTFRGKKYWKDSGRVCRVRGGAKYQLQKSRNKTILRFIGTDSGNWTFCVMSCISMVGYAVPARALRAGGRQEKECPADACGVHGATPESSFAP